MLKKLLILIFTAACSAYGAAETSAKNPAASGPRTFAQLDVVTGNKKQLQAIILAYLQGEWEEAKTLTGHSKAVTCVAYEPRGNFIASGSNDETIKIWDTRTGKNLQTITGHAREVSCVAYSPCGRFIASGSYDKTIKTWDAKTGTCIYTIHVDKLVYVVAYSPCGDYIVSLSHDKTITIWEAATGDHVKTLLGHESPVTCVTWSPYGRYIASGSHDKTIRIWDVVAGTCVKKITGYKETVISVVYSPTGNSLASSCWDHSIVICDLDKNKVKKVAAAIFPYFHELYYPLAWSPDARQLASSSCDSTIKIWNGATSEFAEALEGHVGTISCITYSPCGNYIASGSWDRTIKMWTRKLTACSVAKSSVLHKLASGIKRREKLEKQVRPSKDLLGVVSKIKDIQKMILGYLPWQEETFTLPQQWSPEVCLSANSPCGKYIAVRCNDANEQIVAIVDTLTQKCVQTLVASRIGLCAIAYSPCGNYVAAGGWYGVDIWDVATGKIVKTLIVFPVDDIKLLAYSSSGNYIAGGRSFKDIKIWDTKKDNCDPIHQRCYPMLTLKKGSEAHSHCRKYIAAGLSGDVGIVDAKTEKCIHALGNLGAPARLAAYSRCGKYVAFGTADNKNTKVKIWKSQALEIETTDAIELAIKLANV